jgi:ribonuclease BN (tRNA processing enzyme)
VKVTLVPSSVSEHGPRQHQFLTSYRINDTLAIDAGSLGLAGTVEEQAGIKHVLITHTHMDHIASLPIFVENAYEGDSKCVTIHGSEPVLSSLRDDVFNDRVWPNMLHLSPPQAPFLKMEVLEAERPIELEGLRITPIPVDHVVPTFGFLVEEQGAAVLIVGDTGPTETIWQYANRTPNLKAVFLEATFPNSMAELAEVSKHLTPSLFAREIGKLKRRTRIVAVHIKARYREQIVSELENLGIPELEIGAIDKVHTF